MPGSKDDVGGVLIFLGLILMALLPVVVKFRWLEPRNGSRWARWLLWALVPPGEIVALAFIYFGIRPALIGSPIVSPIDELVQIVVDNIIVVFVLVIFFALTPFGVVCWFQKYMPRAKVPPELTYKHGRERRRPPES
jgi:hypothetical protein